MTTTKFYLKLIDDVCDKAALDFTNSGVDETVLHDLKALWKKNIGAIGSCAHEDEGLAMFGAPVQQLPAEISTNEQQSTDEPATKKQKVSLDDEHLGSDLDSSDEEQPAQLVEQDENLILCLYEKVTRSRNKWRTQLSNGIASIDGRDYVFASAQMDFEF